MCAVGQIKSDLTGKMFHLASAISLAGKWLYCTLKYSRQVWEANVSKKEDTK